jgi:hypothetical protein
MGKYWGKIIFGALLIFGVGFGFVTLFRKGKSYVESSKDLTIPLGSFIPFKLDGQKVGTIRSLAILRSAPKELNGFDLRIRLSDSAAFTKLGECNLSVTDPQHFDERTTFFCLASDSGYQSFGEVRMDLREDGNTRTLVRPLLLPETAIREMRRHASDSVSSQFTDSIAAEVQSRAKVQARAYSDSVRAAELDRQALRMKQKADSLRAKPIPPPRTGSTVPLSR